MTGPHKIVFGILVTLLSTLCGAAQPTTCRDSVSRQGAWQFQTLPEGSSDCFLSVDPFDTTDLIYRSYLATTSGTLMVFNSYDAAETPTSTGARVFLFFPRVQRPWIEPNVAGGTQAILHFATPGLGIVLDTQNGGVAGFVGLRGLVDKSVNRTNQGGLSVLQSPTLYLDVGFAVGHDPTVDLSNPGIFHDSLGKTCRIAKSELFTVTASGDPQFRFSDRQLGPFLKAHCPDLRLPESLSEWLPEGLSQRPPEAL